MRFVTRKSSSSHLRSDSGVKSNLDDPTMLPNLQSRSIYEAISSRNESLIKTKSPRTSKLSPINSNRVERNLKDSGTFLNSIRFRDSKEQSEEMRTKVFMSMLSSGKGCGMSLMRASQVPSREIGLMHGMNSQGLGLDSRERNEEIHFRPAQPPFQQNVFSKTSPHTISSPRVRMQTPPMPGTSFWGKTKR